MRVLLIGGSGFIGRRLVRMLREAGHDAKVFDKVAAAERGELRGDVRDPVALDAAMRQGFDVIYNLAAEHRDDVQPVSLYDEVNVRGAELISAAAAKHRIQSIVFTSSVAVYGEQGRPVDESAAHLHSNDYGRTKSLAEEKFTAWASADAARRLTIVRPTVVFGPGNRGNVYNLLKQIIVGPFLMIGDGENRKSLAEVENVAGFLGFVLAGPAGIRIYNYADTPAFSMNELVAFVRRAVGRPESVGLRVPAALGIVLGAAADATSRLSGKSLPISSVRIRKFQAASQIDAARAFALGYRPAISLEEGLRQMIAAEFGDLALAS